MSDKPSNGDIIELRDQFFVAESDSLRDEVVTKCVGLMNSFNNEKSFLLSSLKGIVVSRCIQLWTNKLLASGISTILVPPSVSSLGALGSGFASDIDKILNLIKEKKELLKIIQDIEQYFKDNCNGYEIPPSLLIYGLVQSKNPRNNEKLFVSIGKTGARDVKISYLSL